MSTIIKGQCCSVCSRERCVCLPAENQKAIRDSLAQREHQRQSQQEQEEQDRIKAVSRDGVKQLSQYERALLRRLIRREEERDAAERARFKAMGLKIAEGWHLR